MSAAAGIGAELLLARAADGDAQAQFDLARDYAARQSLTRARRWFREASARGHAGALCELGLLELFGIGAEVDLEGAVAHLIAAEAAGSVEAAYQLAVIGWGGVGVPFDLARIAERLRVAAHGGHPPALRALALVYARDPALAALSTACLQHAAAQHDAVSVQLLARRGATRGASALPDLPPLPVPALDIATPTRRELLCADPHVETVDDVFNAEECAFVIALGAPYLTASLGIDSDTNTVMRSDQRTSSNMEFQSFQEDFALRWLQWRLVRLTDAQLVQAELTTLLRYLPGEEYRPHRDYLPPGMKGNANDPALPGQRVNTVFCFLSDVEAGGETDFPQLDVRAAPKLGRAVHFKNLTRDGAPDPRTLHAGLPVVRGEKWLATLWTRERRYRAW